MTIERNEWISAAVDGENSNKVLSHLDTETPEANKWQSYHLIGDAMRDDLAPRQTFDISASIAAAIDKEPAILAPAAAHSKQEQVAEPKKGKVVQLLRQFGQYAIAASVAVVAVVGIQGQSPSSPDNLAPLPVLQTSPLVGSASPVSLQAPVTNDRELANASIEEQRMKEQRHRLNAYLQDHLLQQRLNNGVIEATSIQEPTTESHD
ncbi:sigma-E factor negative regulatory protein [Paraferrimonas haliotis]|uniref:Anti-sigma-E factor RseA n=1 Tax=Paraferrimonas haliotis TaxID=2013866 RepID=A0AA37TSY1_9GAMM|nr:RseA family anti-sigma factor [Paraferrimonas haliotis]GLS82509.1 anti-sigma-E factor RseA [Paraferrimonas haliotis]